MKNVYYASVSVLCNSELNKEFDNVSDARKYARQLLSDGVSRDDIEAYGCFVLDF